MEIGDDEGIEVEVGMADYDLEPMDGPTQMAIQNRLSTQERLRLAKRRRAEQLKRWTQREREWKKQSSVNGIGSNNITSNGRALRRDRGEHILALAYFSFSIFSLYHILALAYFSFSIF